jgi:hypothetical protein
MKLKAFATTTLGFFLLMAVGGLVVGCGSSKITASTRCKDYLEQSAEVRHDAAVRISSESRVSDPGNPMWGLSLDAACGSQPDMRIEQYFGSSSARLAQAEAPAQNSSSGSSGAKGPASPEVTLPQSTLSEPAFVNEIEELEGYSSIVLEGSTVVFYLAPIFYNSPLPPHAKKIQESLEASCTAILHSEPFSAVRFQYKSGRVLVHC